MGVAAAELIQAPVKRAGEEALSIREDIEGHIVAGGNAMDAVGNAAIERTAQDARGARGVGGTSSSSCQTLAPLAQTA